MDFASDFQKFFFILDFYVYVIYGLFTAAMSYWYLMAIFKLHQKAFHLFMYSTILIANVAQIYCMPPQTEFYSDLSERECGVIRKLYREYQLGLMVYYSLTSLAHSLFVIKYWALAKTLQGIVSGEQDRYQDCKAQVILWVQVGLILFGAVFYSIVIMEADSLKDYSAVGIKNSWALAASSCLFIPQMTLLIWLGIAIYRLNKAEGCLVSNKRLLLQSSTYFASALSNVITFCYFFSTPEPLPFFIVLLMTLSLNLAG